MNTWTYYLVSYYARLNGGGFGFGRKYIAIKPDSFFNADEFEQSVALEAKLSPKDICILTRVQVVAEEYNLNHKEECHEESIYEINSEVERDTEVEGDLRKQLDGDFEDDSDRGPEGEAEKKEKKEGE